MSRTLCSLMAFCLCNHRLSIAVKDDLFFGTNQLDWFGERYPDAASQKLTSATGEAAKGPTMMSAADLLPTLRTPTIMTSFTERLTRPNHAFPKIPIPLNVPAPPGDPEKPIKPSLDNQYAGWRQIVRIQDLKKFLVKSGKAKVKDKKNRTIAFRANRRMDFNLYSNDFVGNGSISSDANVTLPPFLGEVPYSTKKNATKYLVAFDSDGLATLQAGIDGQFWGFDYGESKVVWVKEHNDALRLQIFLNNEKDVMFLKTVNDYFVSFRGNLFSNSTGKDDGKHGLTLLSILCETGLFYAPKAKLRDMNSYIVHYRRHALIDYHGKISPVFAPYDYSLAVLLRRDLSTFHISTTNYRYEWFNMLYTMTQVIVLNIPEYRSMYKTFGTNISDDFNINAILWPQRDIDVLGVQYSSLKLLKIVSEPPESAKNDTRRLEWAGLVGTLISRAWLRDIKAKRYLILSSETSLHTVLRTFYTWSCAMANLMLPRLPTQMQLEYIEILHPLDTQDAYLEKDQNGQYWFDTFAIWDVKPLVKANILPDLGLLRYLSADFLKGGTYVGARLVAIVISETVKLLSQSNIKGLIHYTNQQKFIAIKIAAEAVCTPDSELRFCLVKAILTQFNALYSSLQTMFPTKSITSLSMYQDTDLKEYVEQLLQQSTQKDLLGVIAMRKTTLLDILAQSMNKPASLVLDTRLELILESTGAMAKSQASFAKHLQITTKFERMTRAAQFDHKLNMMSEEAQAAIEGKSDLTVSMRKLAFRANGEQIVETLVNMVEVTLSAFAVYNPFSAIPEIDPVQIGYMMTDVNRLSKSLAGLVSTGSLTFVSSKTAPKRFASIVTRMIQYQYEVENMSQALRPLLNDSAMELDDTKLEQYAPSFLAAYANFVPPVTSPEVTELQSLMCAIIQAFCAKINIDEYDACMTAPSVALKVFTSLSQSIIIAIDAVETLFQVATAAVNVQYAAKIGKDAVVREQYVQQGTALLRSKWDNDRTKKDLWWSNWKLQAQYTDDMANFGLIISRSVLVQGVIALCNQYTYVNGGIPHTVCMSTIFQLKPISDTQIEILTASKNAESPQEVDVVAYIPTRPSYLGDLAYLDMGKLMNGESLDFQIPMNMKWLTTFGWIPKFNGNFNMKSASIKAINVYLPPRYLSKSKTTHVSVHVNFTGRSILPNGKQVIIPSADFINSYEERPTPYMGLCSSMQLPFHQCDPNLPKVCSTSRPSLPPKLLPSLFGPCKVQASFSDLRLRAKDERYKFTNVTSPIFLPVGLTLVIFSDDQAKPNASIQAKPSVPSRSPKSSARRLSLRTAQKRPNSKKEASTRCCPLGFYKNWIQGSCQQCPINSVSQMGGLYCIHVYVAYFVYFTTTSNRKNMFQDKKLNANPTVYAIEAPALCDYEAYDPTDEKTFDPFDNEEVFQIIRHINDPEHPLTLEQLKVATLDNVHVNETDSLIKVFFTPTIPHCSMATLIGLCLRVKLIRSLPTRFKVDILVSPGSHTSEDAINKQLNDKERVAAALENAHLVQVVNQCIANSDM
uniref:Uncharacterized protein AlNc14C290G10227 n=1 Tax=Albugo laibachii Nc14 TaxID=890382 RepID=F0WV82_9STRA|nr:conserved hypothetical protein [Albugo laibachii Nc14]|eukprot:CCA25321.1 conserved hypothetical protein [Albugo laibachii Nc14]